jgi:hypothetical protein
MAQSERKRSPPGAGLSFDLEHLPMKSLSRSTASFAAFFSAALVFALAASVCHADELVTLCFRNRTVHVPDYLVDRYLAAPGTTMGTCGGGNTAPVFVTQPQPATRYVGGSVIFSAAATGTPTPTYQWYFNGNLIPLATDATITLSNLQVTDAGDYTVFATNAAGGLTSAAAHLTVLDHVVTTTADAGPGSLREVIASAPATTSIRFADHVRGIITLTSQELLIDKNLIIIGPGADLLTVRRGDAAADFRILRVEGSQPSVNISGLTLANGKTTALDVGGGIKNAGDLTLRNCAISGNSSPTGGSGGAIFSATGSALVLDQCTLSQNYAGQGGGGILAMGSFSAINCTFSGNSAPDTGGIYFLNSPSASLQFCTVTGNASLSSAATHAGGIHSAGSSVNIGNTIVAGNSGGPSPDIVGSITSGGNNLIGDGGASVGLTHGVAQDLVGTAAVPLAPLLDILKINGGPTETHALLPGSPAINAADPTTAPAHDQRGVLRSGVPDIGAYEVSPQIFTPKNIELNVSFLNTDPLVTDPMSAPGGPGLKRIYVTATTDPAPPGGARQALKDYNAVEALFAPTDFIVDDTTAGLTYSVQVLCELNSGQQYYFPPVTDLSTSVAPPQWEIANMATLVNFHFVDQATNLPFALNGGLILAHDLNVTNTPPSNLYLTDGATGATFLARGGSFTRFILYADLGGTDPAAGKYRKKYTISTFEATALPGDTIQDVTVMIDTQADTTGSLTGVFDVTRSDVSPSAPPGTDDGFFEIRAPTPIPNDSRPDYPLIHATFVSGDGYGNWEREVPFVGTNFTAESSGGFTAANLLPSPPPGEGRYIAYGESFLRRTVAGNPPGIYGLQFFRTPILGYGSNPAPQIPAGPLVTGETFVIKPGYLTGSLALVGPPVIPGKPAMLAHVARSTAGDTTGDGLPDTDPTEWFYGSVLWANGLDEFADGSTATASGGQSFLPLPGSFNSATGEFTGNYNFALGGLNGEGSVWKSDSLLLSLVNHGNSEATYFDTAFTLTDLAGDAVLRREITAGETAVSDITRTFGEVILTVRAASGTLYQPDIRRVIDDPAHAPNPVALENFAAFGWPTTQAEASETGSIRTLLPAGKWLIYPRINPGNQPPGSNIDLQPIAIDVPARGRLSIEPDFSLQVAIPGCLIGPVATLTGSVASAPIDVTQIRYSIDGGLEIPVGNPNSADPAFSIDLSALEDGEYTITITATGANGEESSITGTFRRDSVGLVTEKAVIVRWNQGVLQTSTTVSGWTDVPGATSPLAVPVNEPKRFWQTYTAMDPAAATLTIEPGIIMTWACGVLQTSTNGMDWTDVPGATSPHAVSDNEPKAFWQIRNE